MISMAMIIFQMGLLIKETLIEKPFDLILGSNFNVKFESNLPVLKQTSKWLFFPKFSEQWDYLQAFHVVTPWFIIVKG